MGIFYNDCFINWIIFLYTHPMSQQESESFDTPYSETTHNICISVKPEVLKENTDPSEQSYSFAYHVRIENLSDENVQLVERHWLISSGGRQIGEVTGPGVVGQQPTLKPGDIYEYTSGAVINDPVGEMYGSYTFRTEKGRYFQASIPRFDLVFDDYLN